MVEPTDQVAHFERHLALNALTCSFCEHPVPRDKGSWVFTETSQLMICDPCIITLNNLSRGYFDRCKTEEPGRVSTIKNGSEAHA